jgi:hypothetical protein
MPATEQTWRNTKLLHMVFGLTSLAMLVVTLWMFADDHNREWKDYQQTYYQKLEVWNLAARSREQQDAEYKAAEAARDAEVARQRTSVPDKILLDLFLAEQHFFQVERGETQGRKQRSTVAAPRENEFAQYVEFLPKATNVLALESSRAALDVEAELLRGDAARATDKDRRDSLESQLKAREAAIAANQAELKRSSRQTSEALAALPGMKDLLGENPPRGEPAQLTSLHQRLVQTREEFEGVPEEPAKDKEAARARVVKARDDFLAALRRATTQARFEEENKQRDLKFRRAELDVVRSDFNLRLGQNATTEELIGLQAAVDEVMADVDSLNSQYESFSRHRKQLDAVLAAMTAGEDAAKKALDQHKADLRRLESQLRESQPSVGKTILGMPILDAFYNSQIKIKQYWLPDLTLNRNFNVVARFDRCESCHLGVLKASPTSPTAPAYEPQHDETMQLATPRLVAKGDEAFLQRGPKDTDLPADFQVSVEEGGLADFVGLLRREKFVRQYDADKVSAFLLKVYGLHLSKEGLWDRNDAMIEYVVRESPAAVAGLKRGDVLVRIDGERIDSRESAVHYLTEHDHWGKPLTLQVRRGVPQPFSTHPRLELYGSDLSPHPFGKFGCTICHDGQGNGTEFKWTTHTPNTLSQAEDWARRLRWFDDVHWIYPMKPKRFAESNCLKCHHDLSELESSERFTEAPAPNLMEGYHTIREYGCFGCHEIKGYDGPTKRIGPDLRLEPNYFAAADQLRYELQRRKGAEGTLREIIQKAGDLRNHPEDNALRRQLQHLLASDDAQGSLPPEAKALVDLFKDEETPGKMRKVGPSLRHVADKLDDWFIYNQIHDPSGFRPTSRMPQFFGLHDFLKVGKDDEANPERSQQEKAKRTERVEKSKRLEQVEILSIVKYLRDKSQPIALVNAPAAGEAKDGAKTGDKKKDDPTQLGKFLFQTRGCLACHQHQAFPVPKQEQQDQGPDLSFVGDKLAGNNGENLARGRKWLYNWLLDPTNYHARTKMPNTFLVPYDEQDAAGKSTGRKINPALEIVNFLLASQAGKSDRAWSALEVPSIPLDDETLNELAIEHLRGASGFTESQAKNFLANGIPATLRGELKGDEVELLQEPGGGFDREKKVWAYLGRRSVSKYGCYACHDVPGFEAAKPIGTALNDWGRKETSKIAFEQVAQYIGLTDHVDIGHGGGHGTKLKNYPDKDKAYFLNSLIHHQRDGFLWQKLRDPRSFDFQTTQNKKYNERLKMPRFRFGPDEKENVRLREKVMTFILGLVNEPPAEKYLYRPDPRKTAINEGRRLLTKYNCGGCHTLEMDTWRIEYDPNDRRMSKDPKRLANEYDFLIPPVSKEALERSRLKNERGRREALITGQQARDTSTGQLVRNDVEIDGQEKYEIGIELWKPAVINGEVWLAKEQAVLLEEQAKQLRPAVGGALARLLAPVLAADERKRNPAAKYDDALAWGPPPLLNEGRKAQPEWLHRFLLEPYQIRPSVALRMPRFNMSSEEASSLASYFAAVDGVDQFVSPGLGGRVREEISPAADERLEDAKKLITNGNYCLKCHHMGAYKPEGSVAPQAPNLAEVYRRLRPEYVRDWVANPARFLPYTGMPVNIPEDKPVRPDQFQISAEFKVGPLVEKGTSRQQLDAVVDFLLNYDRYAQRNEEIKLNEPPKGAKPPGETP